MIFKIIQLQPPLPGAGAPSPPLRPGCSNTSVCSVTSYHACSGGKCLHCHNISPARASWLGMLQHFLQGTPPCVGACEISSNRSAARQWFINLTYMTVHTAARSSVSNQYTVNKSPANGKTREHTQVRIFYTVHHHIGISSRHPACSIYLKMWCVVFTCATTPLLRLSLGV